MKFLLLVFGMFGIYKDSTGTIFENIIMRKRDV